MKYLARLLLMWEKFKALENIKMERKALLDHRGETLSKDTQPLREEMVKIKTEGDSIKDRKDEKGKDNLANLAKRLGEIQTEINEIEGVKGQAKKADIIEKELSAIFNTLKKELWK